MSRYPARLRSVLACVVLLFSAGCASLGTVAPDEGPDLFQALPPPAPPPNVAPPAPAPGSNSRRPDDDTGRAASGVQWQPATSDDFNGPELNTRVWNRYNSIGGFGNGLRRPSAITQTDGVLRITGRSPVSGGMNHEYGQLYGRWEFRARTERGRGFGSAILLWPDSERFPEDGELDIMEVPTEDRREAHFVVHWGARNNIHGTKVPGDFSQWHTFALEWLPDRITWYVDGVKQYENRNKAAIPKTSMHLAIQLDMGPKKDWIPAPDATTPPEVSLEVDWVRVFKAPKGAR